MKIPSKFTLGAIEWKVKLVDELGDRVGECNSETAVILLKRNPNKQVLAQTFCHELMHALFYSAGRNDEHDEVLIDSLGHNLHQFMEGYKDS